MTRQDPVEVPRDLFDAVVHTLRFGTPGQDRLEAPEASVQGNRTGLARQLERLVAAPESADAEEPEEPEEPEGQPAAGVARGPAGAATPPGEVGSGGHSGDGRVAAFALFLALLALPMAAQPAYNPFATATAPVSRYDIANIPERAGDLCLSVCRQPKPSLAAGETCPGDIPPERLCGRVVKATTDQATIEWPMLNVPHDGTTESHWLRWGKWSDRRTKWTCPLYRNEGWPSPFTVIPWAVANGVLAAAPGWQVGLSEGADLAATCDSTVYDPFCAAHDGCRLTGAGGGDSGGDSGKSSGVSCASPRLYTGTPSEQSRFRYFRRNVFGRVNCWEWVGWTPDWPWCGPGLSCPPEPEVEPPAPPPPPELDCDGGAPNGACSPRELTAGTCPEDCEVAPSPWPPAVCGDGRCDLMEPCSCPECSAREDCREPPESGCPAALNAHAAARAAEAATWLAVERECKP
jgi:hypothetical protein